MSDIDRNPPAFPQGGSTLADGREGMSLRDWFAGQALVRMQGTPAKTAEWAYKVADAMLAERAKGGANA